MGGAMLPVNLFAQNTQPNIVLILADDLGWNDIGVMGTDYYETPNIDSLAAKGLLFDNAYAAASNSAPSRASLMTGQYTPRHKVYTVSPSARGNAKERKLIPIPNTQDVKSSFITLAESLKELGYNCGHFGKWHLGSDLDQTETGPLSQGFDHNIAGDRPGTPYSYFYPYTKGKNTHIGLEDGYEGEYLTDRLTDEAIKYISKQDDETPFFVYMAHHAVHSPLVAPQELIDKYKAKSRGEFHQNPVYAAMVENLDTNVGKLCNALDSLGMSDNTIIIFYSDNGGSEPTTDNFMLRGGKGMPYEGGCRVPLIINYPGKVKSGSLCSTPIIGVDIYPTLVKAAGGKIPTYLDGEDIFKNIKSDKRDNDIFWHFPAYLEGYKSNIFRARPFSAIRSGDWKLIYYYEDQNVELFNLKDDIKESNDLSSTNIKMREKLLKKLKRWLEETEADIPTEPNPDYIG